MGSSKNASGLNDQDLPTPDRRLLAHPPLEVAIFEIRLLGGTTESGSEGGLRLLEAVRASGWNPDRVEPAQQQTVQLQLGPQQAPNSSMMVQSSGWQLVETATTTTATVFPDLVIVQTGKYESWDSSFRAVVRAVLEAIASIGKPTMRQRVALRYVDRLVDAGATAPSRWVGRVSGALLGPIAEPLAGLQVLTAQQQIELALESGHGAVLRHGPFADGAERGAISYLVDIDIFEAISAAFDVDDVLHVADLISEEALAVFQLTLTPEYLTELRGAP